MGAKGNVLAEEGHFVNATPAIDINGGTSDSDVWSMAKHAHCTICVTRGVAAASTLTVLECDNFTPSNSTAIAFNYYAETTDGGDTLGARTAATSAGISLSANDNTMYIIEIDAAELSAGRPNLRVHSTDPSAATVFSVLVYLSGSRYAKEQTATAIA